MAPNLQNSQASSLSPGILRSVSEFLVQAWENKEVGKHTLEVKEKQGTGELGVRERLPSQHCLPPGDGE